MSAQFNQGAPSVPTVITSSNVYLFGTSVGNAMTVQQLGTGNVFSAQTASGATSLFVAGSGNVGVGTTKGTETLTVSGNTSFVGSVTVTSDVSGSGYVTSKRVPTGSLSVANYVTGSVPLTTTTSLINNYLSNAATIRANTSTGSITQVLSLPGTTSSSVNFGTGTSLGLWNGGTSNLFVECWVNFNSISATNPLVYRSTGAGGYDWDLFVQSASPYVIFNVFGTSVTLAQASNTVSLSAGTWYHISASWQRTGPTSGTARVFVNGGIGTSQSLTTTAPVNTTQQIWIGNDGNNVPTNANIADIRVMTGSIVPTTNFVGSPQAAPFTTAPTYVTGMNTGYSSNLALALNTQYFPGASTSPYGPVLTLPGTSNSYYTQSTTALNTSLNSGFTIEAWVNYGSLANSNGLGGSSVIVPYAFAKASATTSLPYDWFFGPLTTGQIGFLWSAVAATNYGLISSGTITTGSWNHLVCQANTTGYVNMYINGVQQTLTAQNFAGSGTAVALNISVPANQYSGITVGQYNNNQGPNFALAKARVLFGANTYSVTSFTPSPNLGPIPVGGTVAWQLETQYPLPTYPSIQDITPLPSQLTSYGSLPTPVGGVTSNVLGPYPTTYPQFDSIRFDGTGYIDYGNAASSVLTTNLWANPWTIEAWVYPTGSSTSYGIINRSSSSSTDWSVFLGSNPQNGVCLAYGGSTGTTYYNFGTAIGSNGCPVNTWTHFAITYDGSKSNVYVGGALANTVTPITTGLAYTPSCGIQVGAVSTGSLYFNGNLTDVRVSNAAIYTGSSYTVPSAPLPVLPSTMLLLRSLAGQTGTTLEVQGRGLNTVSLGAGRVVQTYPPAPMSSYLLDTTSNASVTYGQGKYIATASSEFSTAYAAYLAFDKSTSTSFGSTSAYTNGLYGGSVATLDTLGNSYTGEWLQIQVPTSIIVSTTTLVGALNGQTKNVKGFTILGSRDGLNWVQVYTTVNSGFSSSPAQSLSFTVSATQAYTYYRLVAQTTFATTGNTWELIEWVLNGTEESLCVTADSKVGVGIANPQRALEVAGDLVVGGTISGGAGMGMFRNRVINGDMRIAQRGGSLVLSTFSYMADRFGCQFPTVSSGTPGFTYTVNSLTAVDTPFQLGFSNSITYTSTIGLSPSVVIAAFPQIFHPIEGYNITDLNWGTSFGVPVTISLWFKSNSPSGSTFSVTIINGLSTHFYAATFVYNTSSIWQYVTLTIPPPPNGAVFYTDNRYGLSITLFAQAPSGFQTNSPNTWGTTSVRTARSCYPWMQTSGNYVQVTGVQLEKGTVATPFEFRPYATELALCQRYYYQESMPNVSNYNILCPMTIITGTTAVGVLKYPVTMRSNTVTLTSSGTFSLDWYTVNANGIGTLGLIPGGQGSSNYAQLYATSVSNGTAGSVTVGQVRFLCQNTAGGYLAISAE